MLRIIVFWNIYLMFNTFFFLRDLNRTYLCGNHAKYYLKKKCISIVKVLNPNRASLRLTFILKHTADHSIFLVYLYHFSFHELVLDCSIYYVFSRNIIIFLIFVLLMFDVNLSRQ